MPAKTITTKRTLLEQIEESGKTKQYSLPRENGLLMVAARFDKNPVGTHDYTTIGVRLVPAVPFPRGAQRLDLVFSDASLNAVSLRQATVAK